MAIWIGATSNTTPASYNTAGNWSGGVPLAGGTAIFDKAISPGPSAYVNVDVDLSSIATIQFGSASETNLWRFTGSTTASNGNNWTSSGTITLSVPSASCAGLIYNVITGTAQFVKTGPGIVTFARNTGTTVNSFNGGVDLQSGTVRVNNLSNMMGSGTVIMTGGTSIGNGGSGTTLTLQNNVTINGDVTLNDGTGASSLNYTGTVALGASTRTLTFASGGATISGAITGTAGFTKAGNGILTLQNTGNSFTGPSNPLSITGTGGLLFDGSLTTPVATTTLSGITSISIASSNYYAIAATGNLFAVSAPMSGAGLVAVASVATTIGPTFAAGSLSGLTGTTVPTGSGSTVVAAAGFYVYGEGGTANRKASYATVNDFPSTGNTTWMMEASSASCAAVIKYAGAGGTYNGPLYALLRTNTNIATATTALYANGSGALVLTGAFKRDGTTGNFVFTLGGTSASNVNNTLSGNITETGGVFAITKSDANKWILSGTNSYTGATSTVASGGTLVAKKGGATTGALGAASASTAVTIVSGTTLEIDGSAENIALTKTNSVLNIGGTGDTSKGVIYSYGDGIVDSSNSYTAASTLLTATATIQVGTKNTLTMTGAIGSGVNVYGITQIGTGKLVLPSSGYLGVTTINGGTIETATLANGGAASGVGQSSNAATNLLIGTTANAGTLRYTGAAVSTDRNWTAGTAGATIDASGSGVLTMTSTTVPSFSAANTATTITVQGSSGDGTATFNTYSQPVSNNGTGAVGFTKAGTGAWKLTNATLNATGALTISGGFLDLNNTARSLAANIVASGGTLQNGSATVTPASSVAMSGGKITANLAGASKTLTVTGASLATVSELAPEATNNASLTGGTASINSGTLRLTAETNTIGSGGGKVLGTMAATVANGAAIRTTTGVNQRGQARYQNLTFSSGSSLYIGG